MFYICSAFKKPAILLGKPISSIITAMQSLFAHKLGAALLTPPRLTDGKRILIELIWLTPAFGICVLASKEMAFSPQFDSAALRLALIAFFIPSLGEELLFRAAILPKADPSAPLPYARIALSALLFTAWHPLQALLIEGPRAAIFMDPWFLAACGMLGIGCARLYWKSGSIWPSVLLHWLAVIGWKTLAGGPPLI